TTPRPLPSSPPRLPYTTLFRSVHDPVDVVPLDRLTERLTDRRPQLLLGRQVVALTPPVVIQQPRPTRRALTDLLRQLERRLRGRLLTRREHRRGLQEPRPRALLPLPQVPRH